MRWFAALCHKACSFAALLAIAGAAVAQSDGVISAPEAYALAHGRKIILIDIRTPEEQRETGIPAGAKRANATSPQGPAGFLQEMLDIVGDRKDQPIAIICRTGNRTGKARAFLLSKGFTEVYNVSEGVVGSAAGPGWFKRGLPAEPCAC
ncbi:MAG: rhodanese-like domain-containing protein [Rhodocyclaceae bacterium]